jgi:hypothetical protein
MKIFSFRGLLITGLLGFCGYRATYLGYSHYVAPVVAGFSGPRPDNFSGFGHELLGSLSKVDRWQLVDNDREWGLILKPANRLRINLRTDWQGKSKGFLGSVRTSVLLDGEPVTVLSDYDLEQIEVRGGEVAKQLREQLLANQQKALREVLVPGTEFPLSTKK